MTSKQERKFVQGSERKRVARPQPPHRDRRTKRQRDRGTLKRLAIRESF